jgi:hypothetical protein
MIFPDASLEQDVVGSSHASLGVQYFWHLSHSTQVVSVAGIATQTPSLTSQEATEHLHVRS